MEPRTHDVQITVLLNKIRAGDEQAQDLLFEAVYHHLRKLARRAMAGERSDHTLQPTALVNEAFVALFKKGNIEWQNREHFFAQMAKTMRHKLIDYAKTHKAQKKQHVRVPVESAIVATEEDREDLLAIDEALTNLQAFDPEFEQIVELRFYGGLTEEEVAKELGMSPRNVRRKWAAARSLLFDLLGKSQKRKH